MPLNSLIPDPPIRPKLAYGEREAAALLSISPRTLFTLRSEGRIGFVKVGTKVIYPGKALREFIRQETRHGAGNP